MPTREQNLKKALEEARQSTNAFDALQMQIDVIVKYLLTRKK